MVEIFTQWHLFISCKSVYLHLYFLYNYIRWRKGAKNLLTYRKIMHLFSMKEYENNDISIGFFFSFFSWRNRDYYKARSISSIDKLSYTRSFFVNIRVSHKFFFPFFFDAKWIHDICCLSLIYCVIYELPSLRKPHYAISPKLLRLTCKIFIKVRFYFGYEFETFTTDRIF